LDVNAASGAAIDLSDVAFDEIEFSADQAADAVTVANNAHIVISADQTNFSIETEASPNQNVTVELNHDTADTGITLSDLTTTNVNELTLNLTDEDATYELSDISLGTTKLVVTGDADALDVTTYTSFASFDASAISADVTVSDVVTAKQITTGSGADSFTVNDGNTTTVKIDGGSGVDTVVFTANDDFSAGDITFDNIDKLDVSASGVVLAASDVTGSDYIVFGNLLADSLELELNNATGETVDISDMSAALATVTVTGNTGADTITGMLTFATTINAGAGNDTITGGNLVDTIDGEGGNDTIVAGNGADVITGGTGADTIDLSEGTSAVDTVMLDQGDGSAVGAAAGTFSGYDVITGFTLAKDLIDTETGVAAATEVWASTAATTASNDLAASEFTDVDAIVAFINDITANETSVMDTNAITTLAITFDDFTAIYTVDNDATAAVAAAEVELLATVDAIVTATEMT
jgi:Ca2+-binding RTX toxin-like protein